MAANTPARDCIFGPFRLDAATGELFRDGQALKLQHQTARVLLMLVSRAGELVTREELREALWTEGTSVEFDQGLNYCIRQIRAVLGESANEPEYIETFPKRGYRFIGLLTQSLPAVPPSGSQRRWLSLAGAALLLVAAAA